MSVQQLPHGVVKLISSTQIISSVSSVVKELVENSIDAGAGVIDIKLEKTGLEKIEVRDNGQGIAKVDAQNVCLPNYTSKIYSFDDLEKLESYGFRGEALNSLCAVSQLHITTKTDSEEVAYTYTYDNNGTVREAQPSHYMKGTIVSVTNLFKNVPVRRQYYENTRQATAELKRTEKIVKLLSVIHPKLRVTIAHNKCLIWQKTAVFSLRQSLMQVYPHVVLKNLVEFRSTFDDTTVEMLICKRDCNWSVLCQPLNEAILFFVNKRPVKDKKVEKVVLEEMMHLFASSLPHNKCPLTLISLTLSPQNLDVNLEPDKSRIFMKNHEEVLKQIRESIMLHFYEQPVDSGLQQSEKNDNQDTGTKRKIDDDSSVDIALPKRIQYDDVPSIRSLTRQPSNISTHNDENVDPLPDDLLDLDASQFEENSLDNELFSMQTSLPGIPENIIIEDSLKEKNALYSVNGNGECEVEKNVDSAETNVESQMEKNDESHENQPMPSLDISFESILENEKVVLAPAENMIAHNPVDCTSDPSSLNRNESLEHEFNLFLPEDSFEDQKKDFFSNSNIKTGSRSEKILNQTSLSQWSKGLVSVGGNIVEGGAVVATALNARLTKKSDEGVQKMDERLKSNDNFSPLPMERSVSSQMGRKDLAGLTNFARTVRSEIVKENPGISFTKVASELANRWRNLKDDEKNKFSEKSKAEKNRKLNTSNTTLTPLVKKMYINSIDWSVDAIKNHLQKLKPARSQDYTSVIGPLRKESEWVCRIGRYLVAVQIHQLKKNVLVHRDLCHLCIRSQVLDVPLPIDISIIGADLWDILLSLEKCNVGKPGRFFISDPRIVKNGFKIVVEEVEEYPEKFNAVITETSFECRLFVVETLVETLKLIQVNEDLQNCRPAVIKRSILAKFSQSQDNNPTNKSEIQELFAYWVQQMSEIPVCPADIPASVKFYSFSKSKS